jgi:hypothetical protein
MLPTITQAFGQPGSPDSPIFNWPEDGEIVASAARFNAINQALYGFIKQLESETGVQIDSHTATLTEHGNSLGLHAIALAARYTKTESDATTTALTTAITAVQTAIDNLNAIYQTDTEAAAALAALTAQWNATSADFQSTVTGWMNARYTKLEVNNLLDLKADIGDSYQKDETDQLLSQKSNSSHVHLLTVGNGSQPMLTVNTNERIDIKAGPGIALEFDDYLNQILIKTNITLPYLQSSGTTINMTLN